MDHHLHTHIIIRIHTLIIIKLLHIHHLLVRIHIIRLLHIHTLIILIHIHRQHHHLHTHHQHRHLHTHHQHRHLIIITSFLTLYLIHICTQHLLQFHLHLPFFNVMVASITILLSTLINTNQAMIAPFKVILYHPLI
jgi:hypothetical protein